VRVVFIVLLVVSIVTVEVSECHKSLVVHLSAFGDNLPAILSSLNVDNLVISIAPQIVRSFLPLVSVVL
jgi:hypothetical protein